MPVTTTVELSVEGFEEVFADFTDRMNIETSVAQLRVIAERVAKEFEAASPVGVDGNFAGAWHGEVSVEPGIVALEIINDSEYAAYVVNKTGPHKGNPAMFLVDWVMIKLGIADEKEAKSIAYAIGVTKMREESPTADQYNVEFMDIVLEQQEPVIDAFIKAAFA